MDSIEMVNELDQHNYDPTKINIEINILMPLHFNLIIRSYPKFETFLASMNAIISIILLFSNFLLKIINYGKIDFHLMRNLYYIHQPEALNAETLNRELSNKEKRKQSELIINESIGKLDINNYSKGKEINISQQSVLLIESFFKGIEFRKQPIKWLTYLIFCCKNNKKMPTSVNHFFYAQSLLKYDLNILVILKKLIDFENLSEILFDNKQLEAINGIHRRKIYDDMNIEENLRGLRYSYKDRASNERIEGFISGFNHCSKNISKNSQKILNNIKFK